MLVTCDHGMEVLTREIGTVYNMMTATTARNQLEKSACVLYLRHKHVVVLLTSFLTPLSYQCAHPSYPLLHCRSDTKPAVDYRMSTGGDIDMYLA